jgi:hypothetical protein
MVQKKRKQGLGNQAPSKKQKQDGQKAVSKDINIPIDEGFKKNGELAFPVQSQSWRPPQQFFNDARGQGPLGCHVPGPIKRLNCVLGRLD